MIHHEMLLYLGKQHRIWNVRVNASPKLCNMQWDCAWYIQTELCKLRLEEEVNYIKFLL